MLSDNQHFSRVLYLGDDSLHSTSLHRANALRSIGCTVDVVNPYLFLPPLSLWQQWLNYRTGYRLFQNYILRKISQYFQPPYNSYDLLWVNGGELFGPRLLSWFKKSFNSPILLYQNDDPTGTRDGARFGSLRSSLPFYDFCVLVRPETALESLAYGSPKTLRVLMSFDEEVHTCHQTSASINLSPSVAFVGSLIPGEGRDQFLHNLIKAGIPLEIRGNNWNRSNLLPLLKSFFVGPGVTGHDYAHVLQSATACIGLLSHQNRDLHTRRSVEIPACGGVLCAERTSEHQLLFEEGIEAVFWDCADECASACNAFLSDSQLTSLIRSSGSKRVHEIGVGNEDICRQILSSILP